MRIRDVFKERRSAYNFREDFEMNKMDFESIFELARYSPSIYNTQSMRYLVTMDKEKQRKLRDLSKGQHKIATASGVILVLSEKNFLSNESLELAYRPSVQVGIMSEEDLDLIKHQMNLLFEESKQSKHEYDLEMYRNAFINIGMLIAVITVLGFDTCPMHVHNVDKVKELFNIPDNLELLFMLPVGKRVEKERPRGYRKQVNEILTFENF